MARGALALAKGQLDEDDEKLQALADLAQVQSVGGKLQIDLALPAEQLFDRRCTCPVRASPTAARHRLEQQWFTHARCDPCELQLDNSIDSN
jgi:hypothetical protein